MKGGEKMSFFEIYIHYNLQWLLFLGAYSLGTIIGYAEYKFFGLKER